MTNALTPEDRRSIAAWINQQMELKIQAHLMEHHKRARSARWKAPTLDEMLEYQAANPELAHLDVRAIHKGYNDSGWVDTKGNPVKNWKLKMWTLAGFQRERMKPEPAKRPVRLCDCGCGQPARTSTGDKWFATSGCRKKVLGW